jgi:CHAT domain-containing protein
MRIILLIISLSVMTSPVVVSQTPNVRQEGAESPSMLLQPQKLVQQLGPGTVLIYVLILEKHLLATIVTSEGPKVIRQPINEKDLERQVSSFRNILMNPALDPVPLAQELYGIVVRPLEAELRKADAQTIMWNFDGSLRNIPVNALHDGQKYMIEKYRNVVFTPLEMTRLSLSPKQISRGLALGVSNPLPGFSALAYVPDELNGVRNAISSPSERSGKAFVRLFLNEEFTFTALASDIGGWDVVHIATHFNYVSTNNGRDSYLLLGDGSHLTIDKLMRSGTIFSNVELLTLSACNSLTAGENGVSAEGFPVTLQRMGAKSVLASLWPVADESTSLLMQKFYSRWQDQGWTLKGEALRQSQLDMLSGNIKHNTSNRENPDSRTSDDFVSVQSPTAKPFKTLKNAPFAHPFYWSPFVLIGNWK